MSQRSFRMELTIDGGQIALEADTFVDLRRMYVMLGEEQKPASPPRVVGVPPGVDLATAQALLDSGDWHLGDAEFHKVGVEFREAVCLHCGGPVMKCMGRCVKPQAGDTVFWCHTCRAAVSKHHQCPKGGKGEPTPHKYAVSAEPDFKVWNVFRHSSDPAVGGEFVGKVVATTRDHAITAALSYPGCRLGGAGFWVEEQPSGKVS